MAKKIKQFYYNQPEETIVISEYSISRLNILTSLSDIGFYINSNKNNLIKVFNGQFDIDLKDYMRLNYIEFSGLNNLKEGEYLIIEIIYDE